MSDARREERRYLRALGLAIRKCRGARHLSQERLGEMAHLHRTYIGGMERGERNATVQSLLRVARALDTTIAALLREAERMLADLPEGE